VLAREVTGHRIVPADDLSVLRSHNKEQRSRSAVSCSSVAMYSSPRNMRRFISLSGIARMYP
jgi:hypothetical protein